MTRIMIEYITERIVVDYNPDIPDSAVNFIVGNSILDVTPQNPPILRKYHLVHGALNELDAINGSKVNLILRDYYTAINSHAKRGGSAGSLRKDIEQYCGLIKFYDSYSNKGSLMYYEDLIDIKLQPGELQKLFDDNGITSTPNWDKYLENIYSLNNTSKESYINRYNSVSSNTSDRQQYTDLAREVLGEDLFNKYLFKYV